MKIFIILLSFFFAFSPISVCAEDFSLNLISVPSEVPLGAPVHVIGKVVNSSGRAIEVVHYGYSGFYLHFEVIDKDGKSINSCSIQEAGKWVARLELLPTQWRQTIHEELNCLVKPGEYFIRMALHAESGPFHYSDNKNKETKMVTGWTGDIRSEKVKVRIVEPKGIERDAHQAIERVEWRSHRDELICRFPASIYTAYAWIGIPVMDPIPGGTVKEYLDHLSKPENLSSHSVPDCKGGSRSLTREESQNDDVKWASLILNKHPEFQFRDAVRFRLAIAQLGLRNYEDAAANFRILSERAEWEFYSQRAGEFLVVMRETKLVKQ